MLNKKYLIVKKKEDKAVTYFEYDKMNGYDLSPKKGIKIEDAINVNKIVIINPSLANKVAKKKIDLKFRKLVKLLNIVFETDDDTGTAYREALDEVNKLKMELINKYKKLIFKICQKIILSKIYKIPYILILSSFSLLIN